MCDNMCSGRQFSFLKLSSFLNIGDTSANLRSSAKIPFAMQSFIVNVISFM